MPDELKSLSKEIRQRLKDALGAGTFREYYIGDPLQIPQSSLPCVIIEKESETVEADATGLDKVETTILVKLVVNKKDDFGRVSKDVLWRERLESMAAARDKTTKQFKDESVLGVLRKQFTLGNRVLNHNETVEYGLTPRPQDVITEEAHIRITFTELVEVPSRT